jgi:hypothetical protein
VGRKHSLYLFRRARVRNRKTLTLITVLGVLLGAFASVALAATPVVDRRRISEVAPAAAPGYLAWSQNTTKRPRHFNLFARPSGGTKFKVNPRRTEAFITGAAIAGNLLAYHQSGRAPADIKFFNLKTRQRKDPQRGINTGMIETYPSISGRWLLFDRTNPSTGVKRIILRNLKAHRSSVLARGRDFTRRGRRYVQGGTVEGLWASWLKCRNFSFCTVRRYNIRTGRSAAIPNPRRRAQFAASVTGRGTVYFAEASFIACGRNPGIWRHTRGGPRKEVIPLRFGRDTSTTSPLVGNSGTTIFFDRFNCNSGRAGIYKAPG